ncbi:Rna recognition motif-containing protein, partial [Cardiosporidium cionae]
MCPSHNGIRGRRRERSRSRSKSRGSRSQSRSREERRAEIRRRRTGWDTGTEKSTTPDVTTSLASFTGGIGFSTSGVPAVTQCNTLSSPSADTQGAQLSSNALAIAYQKRAMCRIYVGSLDYYLTVEEIKRVFQAFGTIVAVDMPKEGDRSKGFCFVEFSTPESAEMSLSAMQGFLLKGRSIKVGRPSAVGIPLPPAANLASAVGGNSLVPSQAGALAAAAVLSSKANCTVDINAILQKSGASGITNLASLTSPQATTDPTVPSPSRIYVGNVPFSFTGADLEKIFNVFGKILSCYLLPNNENPGTHRGYGFIDFTEPSHAKLAIDTMNGFKVA